MAGAKDRATGDKGLGSRPDKRRGAAEKEGRIKPCLGVGYEVVVTCYDRRRRKFTCIITKEKI